MDNIILEQLTLDELRQRNEELALKIEELQKQQRSIECLINERSIKTEGITKKDLIIRYINDGFSNKKIEELISDATGTYIRQVRSEHIGSKIKRELYKDALGKSGNEKLIKILALNAYHKISYDNEKHKLNANKEIVDFANLAFKYYRYGVNLDVSKAMSIALSEIGYNSDELLSLLFKFFKLIDEKYLNVQGKRLKKESEISLPELVLTIIMLKNISEVEYRKSKSKLQTQYNLSESYLYRIVYVIDTLR